MSFLERTREIKEGDLVICYSTPQNMKPIKVRKDGILDNRNGHFQHNDMIGKEFGSKIEAKTGYLTALYPTPELWTLSLPHRTQILYQPDISLISTFLKLQPGTDVIEAGTGSGSFSHSIARTIAPHGKLYTFEYHKERSEKAAEEFREHGMTNVSLTHADVCLDGFGMEDKVTAVFLDLPSPWEALESAKKAFKRDRIGRICCFSPCIEQVQKTCSALQRLGFSDIRMFEVLVREHDIARIDVQDIPQGTGYVKLKKKRFFNDDSSGLLGTRIKKEVRGHTSFLTFATFYPE
jgi:tRNA (adenine57-N1/adenine58-N1)-methyltransferase